MIEKPAGFLHASNTKSLVASDAFPQLPVLAEARSGAKFAPSSDRWEWRDSAMTVSLNFLTFRELLSPRLLQNLKLTLIWYAKALSPSGLVASHSQLLHFLRAIKNNHTGRLNEIRGVDIANYHSHLREDQIGYLGRLAGVLRRWQRLDLDGVADAVCLLDDMRIGGGPKGVAVKTRCPIKGPLTQIEQEAVHAAIDEAFIDGLLEESHYLLAWLFSVLGARPSQYAALKVCDIERHVEIDGVERYLLQMPRAKQGFMPRTSFKPRSLIPNIGKALFAYAQRVREKYQGLLDEPSHAPMFPERRPDRFAPGFEYHYTAKALGKSLSSALDALTVISERTGEPMHLNPVRFRRTLATRAAQEGHGELVIAELLDHSDLQNVQVYVSSVPEIAARIDRAVAFAMAPLAQAFKGIVIHDESRAIRGDDPSSRIRDFRVDQSGKPVGSCGSFSFCGLWAPISCYTCSLFEAWLDGPHEAMLTYLMEERERKLVTSGERIASINDRTILAVADVVQQCRDQREERRELGGPTHA